MGYIYVITNCQNNKQYIGQTSRTIKERYKEHLKDSQNLNYKYPLYLAMRKYGVEQFFVKQIEECPNDKLNEREIYWINKLNTYKNGYNATTGGQGSSTCTKEEIIQIQQWWNEGKSAGEIKTLTGRCKESISHILQHYCNISQKEILSRGQQKRDSSTRKGFIMTAETRKEIADSQKKWVQMTDVKTNLPIKKFFGLQEAILFLRQNGYPNANKSGISRACNNIRKTYYGYKWEYL